MPMVEPVDVDALVDEARDGPGRRRPLHRGDPPGGRRGRRQEVAHSSGVPAPSAGLDEDAQGRSARRLHDGPSCHRRTGRAAPGGDPLRGARPGDGRGRSDLTEFVPGSVVAPPPAATFTWSPQTRDELEDVFVGMGFEVAEGPEIEIRLVQLRGAQHPAGTPGARDVGHPLPRPRRSRDGPAAHPHLAGADPPDGGGRGRRLPIHAVMPGPVLPPGHARRAPPPRLPPDRGTGGGPGHHLRRPGRHHRGVHHCLLRRPTSTRAFARPTSRSPSRRPSSR